jgi:hypothetical protein
MLRVDPSFQVLASSIVKLNFNKELSQLNFKKDNPELRQTRVVKQVIIVKHKHNTFSRLDPCMVPDHISRVDRVGNLSLVSTRSKQAPTLRRSLNDQRQTGPAVVLGHLIPPPSRQSWSKGERFRPSGYTTTSAYWAHIPVCNRYIQ